MHTKQSHDQGPEHRFDFATVHCKRFPKQAHNAKTSNMQQNKHRIRDIITTMKATHKKKKTRQMPGATSTVITMLRTIRTHKRCYLKIRHPLIRASFRKIARKTRFDLAIIGKSHGEIVRCLRWLSRRNRGHLG